jgi:hypothetical protein
MSMWWGAVVVATGLFGLVGKWMVLRFLQRIYERGGREDMTAAAEALRHVRAWHTTRTVAAKRLRRAANPHGNGS